MASDARKAQQRAHALTVKNAKPGRHADGGGLHLLVKESGARSWVYRFMLKGKSRDIGLGAAAGPGSDFACGCARDSGRAAAQGEGGHRSPRRAPEEGR